MKDLPRLMASWRQWQAARNAEELRAYRDIYLRLERDYEWIIRARWRAILRGER